MRKNHIKVLIICGCSYSGKTVLAKNLDNFFIYNRLISHTTRPMRPEEVNHIDYHFISDEEFNIIKNNNYPYFMGVLENFDGYQYGTLFSSLIYSGSSNINVVVLSYDGIVDYLRKKDYIESLGNFVFDTFIFGLDIDDEYAIKRGRSKEFLRKERHVLSFSDKIYRIKPSKDTGELMYITPVELTKLLLTERPELFSKEICYDQV